jgi:hypothetical protein
MTASTYDSAAVFRCVEVDIDVVMLSWFFLWSGNWTRLRDDGSKQKRDAALNIKARSSLAIMAAGVALYFAANDVAGLVHDRLI